jgi:hypothetical protein
MVGWRVSDGAKKMITVTEYKDDKLGLILGFQDDESMLLNMQGRSYVVGEYDGAFTYILNGQPTERPASPVTRTDLTLFDVPNGATLWINGVSYAAEGEVELEFPLPGTYSLQVECWPYKDWEGEVVVP